MSDFLFTTRRRAPGELRAELERWLGPVTAACDEWHGDWGSLAVARGHHDREVVREDGRFVSVLVGEPVVRIAPEPAGTARGHGRRLAAHRLMQRGADQKWEKHFDGHFAALLLDTRDGGGLVLSDLASFIPLFQAVEGEGTLVVGTHVDAVARAAGRIALDPVSAADLLVNLSATYPHTLYRGVEQFPPAAARAFGRGGWSAEAHVYWRPREGGRFRAIGEAAEALRAAVADDVRAATAGFDTAGLLLSGGEDSRAVLGAVPGGVKVRAFVYA
ncbi:MAG TPA: hypothetical protein VNP72_04305, partial [Longimicrobium sp.]|nr:hypothetical protein [Longimicrobium sp.]